MKGITLAVAAASTVILGGCVTPTSYDASQADLTTRFYRTDFGFVTISERNGTRHVYEFHVNDIYDTTKPEPNKQP